MPFKSIFATTALLLLLQSGATAAEYYEGKSVKLVVGLSPGGTTDVFVRTFAEVWQKYIPGHPQLFVENKTGAGGLVAAGYVYEEVQPDGLTLLFSNWSPVNQALGMQSVPVSYDKFEFVGAVGLSRLVYGRTDMVPGGLKEPADIAKASDFNAGGLNPLSSPDLLMRLSLDLLGLNYHYIPGYKGGSGLSAAILRDEIQLTTSTLVTFKTRNAEFIESGQGRGLYYLTATDDAGNFKPNPHIADMPALPELYRQIHGRPPSGPSLEALNWLVRLADEMTVIAVAPPGTSPEALTALRSSFAAASQDEEFRERTIATAGFPFSFVYQDEGEAILRSLAEVPPGVVETLSRLVESAK